MDSKEIMVDATTLTDEQLNWLLERWTEAMARSREPVIIGRAIKSAHDVPHYEPRRLKRNGDKR